MPDKDRSLVLIARGLEDKATGVAINADEEKHQKLTFFERVSCADFKNTGTYLLFDELDEFGAVYKGAKTEISSGNLCYDLAIPKRSVSGYTFSYYLMADKVTAAKLPYSDSTKAEFKLLSPGRYKIKCFVLKDDAKLSFVSDEITVKSTDV